MTDLKVDEELIFNNVAYGNHLLRCYTRSNLEIKSELKLIGTEPDLRIAVDINGKITKQ